MLLLSKMRAKAAAFAKSIFEKNGEEVAEPHGRRVSLFCGKAVFFI
jgi:hypothetical protein